MGAIGAYHFALKKLNVGVYVGEASGQRSPDKPLPPSTNSAAELTMVVFFQNGSATLSKDSLIYIGKLADALSRCEGSIVEVSSSTSSADYPIGSKLSNSLLAMNRVTAVEKALRIDNTKTELIAFTDELDLEWARLVRDSSMTGFVESLAALNRRAEVRVKSFGSCSLRVQGSKKEGSKKGPGSITEPWGFNAARPL